MFADIPSSQLDEDMDEPEVDEFGRVRELRNSVAARERRRAERRQRVEKQAGLGDLSADEATREQGLWTDDEMGEDYSVQKDTKLGTIQTEKMDELMSDVGAEFKSIRTVKDKFEAWKLEYYDDYQKAYGSLSLPGAFEFYVRSELVSWDPFSVSSRYVCTCNLFVLISFCRIQWILILCNGTVFCRNMVSLQNTRIQILKC